MPTGDLFVFQLGELDNSGIRPVVAVVGAPDSNRVSLYRGPGAGAGMANVANYSCAPRCERTPMPGELESEYNRYGLSFGAYAQRAAEARRAVTQTGQ